MLDGWEQVGFHLSASASLLPHKPQSAQQRKTSVTNLVKPLSKTFSSKPTNNTKPQPNEQPQTSKMILHDQRRQNPSERLRSLQPEDKSQVIRTRRPAPGHRPKLQSHDMPTNACAVFFSTMLYRCTVIPSHAITSCLLGRCIYSATLKLKLKPAIKKESQRTQLPSGFLYKQFPKECSPCSQHKLRSCTQDVSLYSLCIPTWTCQAVDQRSFDCRASDVHLRSCMRHYDVWYYGCPHCQ